MVSLCRSHLQRRARLALCRAGETVTVVAAVTAICVLIGQWMVAVLAAAVVVGAVVAVLAALEGLGRGRKRRPVVVVARPLSPSPDHVAFAQALTAVATAYLSVCQGEESRP
jgi:hypothetical protein